MQKKSVPKIFLVEDDAELCQGWADVFDLLGYPFRSHQNGRAALLDEEGIRSSDILITDYHLPDINGVDLVKRARAVHPEMQSIVLTGSRENAVAEAVREAGNCALLHKPIDIDALENEILRLLGQAV